MAVLNVLEPDITDDDQQKLTLAESYHQMSKTSAWKDLMKSVEELISAAKEDLFSNQEQTGRDALFERWRQREFAFRAITTLVDSHLRTREEILEEAKERESE